MSIKDTYWVDMHWWIIKEVSLDKIWNEFKSIFAEVKWILLEKFSDLIHSAYIYGSVVTWKAIRQKSDLDILIVLNTKDDTILKEIFQISKELSKKYKKTFREVWIEVSHLDEILSDEYGRWCFVKHLSVCFYWEDIWEIFNAFKPSTKVAKAFNWDFDKVLSSSLQKLKQVNDEDQKKTVVSNLMRKIIRTWFSLVMDRENSRTTDLHKSFEMFSKYYPNKSDDMKIALDYCNWLALPDIDVESYADNFCVRLASEVEKVLFLD